MSGAAPDPIADAILALLGDGRAASPQAIERAIGAARARATETEAAATARYRVAVRQQLLHLARSGAIDFLRKGERVDPDAAKGVIKVRLHSPAGEPS